MQISLRWVAPMLMLPLVGMGCAEKSAPVPLFRVQKGEFVRRVTAEGNLKAKTATPLTAPVDAPGPLKLAWMAPDGARLAKGDVIIRFDPTEFENQLLVGEEDEQETENTSVKQSKQAGTTRTNLQRDARVAEDELETARRFQLLEAEIFSRWEQVESQLDEQLALDKKEHAIEVLGVRDRLSSADRDLLAIEQRKAQLKIRNAERGLHSLEVVAPHDGILVLQRDWRGEIPRVGMTVWTGMRLGEIPDVHELEAEVFVLEADAAGLQVGEPATVRLESDPSQSWKGEIVRLDKLARARLRGVPVQYFGVTLSLEKTDPKLMKPGARVRALLELERTPRALTIPRQALFDQKGTKVVYRKKGSAFEAVEVETGAASVGRIVVTRGLVEGDEIALRDPSELQKKRATGRAGSQKDS